MKFVYRSVADDATIATAPAPETEECGTFLGQRYALKQPTLMLHQPLEELMYRGVAHTR